MGAGVGLLRHAEAIARGVPGLRSLGRMRIRSRRRIDVVLLALAVPLLVGAVAAISVATTDTERVTSMWAAAMVDSDGNARITEVTDYDFGAQHRHGIIRDIPGLFSGAPVEVRSTTAPDDVVISGSRIRIGDPYRTVTGRHRYTMTYGLDRVAPDGRLAWDAVGTEWHVGISNVEIHVVAPFALDEVTCRQGPLGATTECSVAQPEPGHLIAEVDALRAGEGVTLFASAGPPLRAPSLPAPPSGAPANGVSGWVLPGLLAAVVAVVGATPTSRFVRLAGREHIAAGSVAGMVIGDAVPGTGNEIRVDAEELASLATIEVAPPSELTAAEGGVVLAETVREEHKVAWLVSAAIDGYIDIEDAGTDTTLVRLPRHDGSAARILDVAFAGRERLPLGSYDTSFAAAWETIADELAAWQRASGLWDAAADRRSTLVRLIAAVVAVAGLALTALGGALLSRSGTAWLVLVAAGALLAGVGLAALVRGWELRVRTPAGAALWLRVDSFRRYLAASEARHVDDVAKRGLLQEYTAWAVAFGEERRWSRTVAASAVATDDRSFTDYSQIAPRLASATTAASHEPSSSGSSGGGGVGGGAGGGGGGSW
jgi:hypothetical protein